MAFHFTVSSPEDGEVQLTYPDVGGIKYRPSFGVEGHKFPVTYYCSWTNRFAARRILLGKTEFVDFGNPQYGYLSRRPPHAHEEMEGKCFCRQVDIEPWLTLNPPDSAGTTEAPNATRAILTCLYDRPDYEILPDTDPSVLVGGFPDESTLKRYISIPQPKNQNRQIPVRGGGWKFEDTGITVSDTTVINVTDEEILLTWRQIPVANYPRAQVSLRLNTTNDDTFFTYPANTLVLMGVTYENISLPDFSRGLNVTFVLAYKKGGANSYPDADRGHRFFPVIARDGSGNRPYTSSDFKFLLRPVAAA